MFSTLKKIFLHFPSNLRLLSADSFSLGMGYLILKREGFLKTLWESKKENAGNFHFLAPLAVMARCPSCVHPCVNFFFKHLLLWNYLSDFDEISQKCSWHGPHLKFLKEFDSFKNSGCHGNKTEIFLKSLKIFLSETIMPRTTEFGM